MWKPNPKSDGIYNASKMQSVHSVSSDTNYLIIIKDGSTLYHSMKQWNLIKMYVYNLKEENKWIL